MQAVEALRDNPAMRATEVKKLGQVMRQAPAPHAEALANSGDV